jgi:hypothetical protein
VPNVQARTEPDPWRGSPHRRLPRESELDSFAAGLGVHGDQVLDADCLGRARSENMSFDSPTGSMTRTAPPRLREGGNPGSGVHVTPADLNAAHVT